MNGHGSDNQIWNGSGTKDKGSVNGTNREMMKGSDKYSMTIVGLGSGDESQLTLGVLRELQEADAVFLRTEEHPVTAFLKQSGISWQSFDHIYEAHDQFHDVYEEIVEHLMGELRDRPGQKIVYAVPGHPLVAESTVHMLRERIREQNGQIDCRILGGESFLDQAFVRFGFDPLDGLQLVDATRLDRYRYEPSIHTLFAQVYDRMTASDVKLALMEWYPDEYEVVVGHALGVAGEETIRKVPLYELDRIDGYGNLSLIWVPKDENESLRNRTFERLHEIVEILRSPEGCPWDREQTHASIRKNLIEETYEVLETIDEDDPDHMCEELGDLLLQIMLHSQMEQEVGTFNVYDVIQGINEKLIRRHPHVFGDRNATSATEALSNWESMKREEKRKKGEDVDQMSVLAGVPRHLPGLMKALKLQKKVAKVGFDWDHRQDVWAKLEEELGELREVLDDTSKKEEQIDELGDLLFVIVNLARFLDIDPEEAIARTNRKFVQRFTYIEEQLRLRGRNFDQTDLTEMEEWWQQAKNDKF